MQINTADIFQVRHPQAKSPLRSQLATVSTFKKHALSALSHYVHAERRYNVDKRDVLKSNVDFAWAQLLFVFDVIKESNDYSLDWEEFMSWRQILTDAASAYLVDKDSLDGHHKVIFGKFREWVNIDQFDDFFKYV